MRDTIKPERKYSMSKTFIIRDSRQLRAMTGVSEEQFETLKKAFDEVYEELKQKEYEEAVERGERKRKRGGGRKGNLPTIADKLLFVLFYLKVYPTFDVIAGFFGMSRSKACENLHNLLPVLNETLARLGVLPHRTFDTVDDMRKAFEGIDKIIIDVTERLRQRPEDSEKQSEMYSGKKKTHTSKNTIISSVDKVILFLGQTFPGHTHDYKMLKNEFPPDEPWFEHICTLADLGYQGINKDYDGNEIYIPHKKPRKSKKNPEPELAKEQKETNTALSKVRIFVENAIGGIKRFNILVHAFRNRKKNFDDDVIALCSGLWNMMILA